MRSKEQPKVFGAVDAYYPPGVSLPTKPDENRRASKKRIIISLLILASFWGAMLYDYWPDLLQIAARTVYSTQKLGSKPIQSHYFEVRNISSANDAQIAATVTILEKQYEAITRYLKVTPTSRLPVLIVNGNGPAFNDGSQLLIYDNKGIIDTDLAPIFIVLMVEKIEINLAGQFIPAGGFALDVAETTGLGHHLTWQPLDAWVVLLRDHQVYIPLKDAWVMKVPSDDNGAYYLLRALLESGSFMRWFSSKYGLEAARLLASGETEEKVTGKDLAQNEAEWLASLKQQTIHPRSCAVVIPSGSMFHFICAKIDSGLK